MRVAVAPPSGPGPIAGQSSTVLVSVVNDGPGWTDPGVLMDVSVNGSLLSGRPEGCSPGQANSGGACFT